MAGKDYRVTVKVRNNRLLKAIEAAGGTPGNKWCQANGLVYPAVNDLVNMTASPLLKSGGLTSTADRLCTVLGALPEDLWSANQLYPLERNFSDLEMDHEQVLALASPDAGAYLPDNSGLLLEETRRALTTAMSLLDGREVEVLRLRFEEGLTLKECGVKLRVCSVRVEQIEKKAIKKLRGSAGLSCGLGDLDDYIDG